MSQQIKSVRNRNHWRGVLLLQGLLSLVLVASAQAITPEQIDQKLKPVLKDIQEGEKYVCLATSYEVTSEGVPPRFKFYIADYGKPNSYLVVCEVVVGHETWSKTFFYYFDAQARCLKYTETVSGHEEHHRPLTLYFDEQGRPLGKAGEAPRVHPGELVKLYRLFQTHTQSFYGY